MPEATTTAIDAYYQLGRDQGMSWTPLSRKVLQILHGASEPLGAYAIHRRLPNRSGGRQATSVYRQLAKLIGANLVVALASPKRFLISPDPTILSWLALKCASCARVDVIPAEAIASALAKRLNQTSFIGSRVHLECWGLCRRCAA